MPEGQGQGQEVDILDLFCQPLREATSLGNTGDMGASRSTPLGRIGLNTQGKAPQASWQNTG